MYCKKCKIDKLQSEFSKSKSRKNGLRSYCKLCEKTATTIWRQSNRSKDRQVKKVYYEANKKQIMIAIHKRAKARRKTDIEFRITCNLRRRLNNALHGKTKSKRTIELLGCTIPELKLHLSKNFSSGMSWDNYGKWHIDHIIPCSSFDLIIAEQQEQCFHYSNLQPLWANDNLKKSKY
jgi:hypothetical protein